MGEAEDGTSRANKRKGASKTEWVFGGIMGFLIFVTVAAEVFQFNSEFKLYFNYFMKWRFHRAATASRGQLSSARESAAATSNKKSCQGRAGAHAASLPLAKKEAGQAAEEDNHERVG